MAPAGIKYPKMLRYDILYILPTYLSKSYAVKISVVNIISQPALNEEVLLSTPAGRVHSSQWPGRYSIPVQIVRAKHLSCEQRQTIDENREIGKHRSNTRNFLGCRCLWGINLNVVFCFVCFFSLGHLTLLFAAFWS